MSPPIEGGLLMRGLLRLEASRRAEWIKRGPFETGLTGLSRQKNKMAFP
jgi:hypothetical protein